MIKIYSLKGDPLKKSPHVFILIIVLIFCASLLTYIIPAGSYQRVLDEKKQQTLVVADSYQEIEQSPIGFWRIPKLFVEAMSSAGLAKLIFFILLIGGSFGIIMDSGAIQGACSWVITVFKGKRKMVIPIFVCLFSIFGFTMGLATASIIFVPFGIIVARALGYDMRTGMAMVMLGTNAGFTAGIFNPFSVGIAQNIAEIPIFSGAWLRWILLVTLLAATSIYILFKAEKNHVIEVQEETLWEEALTVNHYGENKVRHFLVLLILAATMVILSIGVSLYEWDIENLSVTFLISGILSGIVSGYGANKICLRFVEGSKKMMTGAFVIALAGTMRLILEQGMIIDTMVHAMVSALDGLPSWLQLSGMFLVNALIDPFITSGSAHATVVMPLMVPLADGLNLTRQSSVLAFQLGDGLMNLVSPISTTLTSCLALTGLTYEKWLRYYLPLVGAYLVIGELFIIFAGSIGY